MGSVTVIDEPTNPAPGSPIRATIYGVRVSLPLVVLNHSEEYLDEMSIDLKYLTPRMDELLREARSDGRKYSVLTNVYRRLPNSVLADHFGRAALLSLYDPREAAVGEYVIPEALGQEAMDAEPGIVWEMAVVPDLAQLSDPEKESTLAKSFSWSFERVGRIADVGSVIPDCGWRRIS